MNGHHAGGAASGPWAGAPAGTGMARVRTAGRRRVPDHGAGEARAGQRPGSWEGPVGHRLRYAAGAGAVADYLALQWLGHNYGTTRAERRRRLPGDELTGHPMAVTTHAITIGAQPERVFPWLVQMGWHRGAWYTARWVDWLLFPTNDPSADRLIPGFQHLAVGDRV